MSCEHTKAISFRHTGGQCTAEQHQQRGDGNATAPTWWGCVPDPSAAESAEEAQYLCVYRLPKAAADSQEEAPAEEEFAPESLELASLGFLPERGPNVEIFEHPAPQCTTGNHNSLCDGSGTRWLSCQPGLNGQDCAHLV
jgi:hypothetical protein